MANEPQQIAQINRIFEQPADSVSFYSDVAQILGTEHEVVLQFYDSIPGAPGPGGAIQLVRSRLRSTIVVSRAHAANIGRLLLQQSGGAPASPDKGGASA